MPAAGGRDVPAHDRVAVQLARVLEVVPAAEEPARVDRRRGTARPPVHVIEL
jgi:hypothetical protein